LFFLKNLETFDDIPQILNEPVFQKGFEKAKIAKMSNKDFAKYEQSRLAYFESKAVVDTAHLEAKEETTITFIESCILDGLSVERTAKLTKVSVEYVKQVIQKLGLTKGDN
jgi:hypothetical protein